MRKAKVYMLKELAGFLVENENGYSFIYDEDYINISFLPNEMKEEYIKLISERIERLGL
jgi:hypothetical protein